MKKIRYLFGVFILLFSASLLVWSYFPVQRQIEVQSLTSSDMVIQSTPLGDVPALLETRQVSLEWPESMRIGDDYTVVLDFEQVEDSNTTLTVLAGFSNVYDCCNVMADARLEVSGINVDPVNSTRESMPPGQPVGIKWRISADQAGTYNGTIWLSLRFLPLDGSTPIQGPIYVNDIQFDASRFLGLSGGMARIVGWVGVILGVCLISDAWINMAKCRGKKDTIATDN
jgi:hypothetical protein